MRDAARCAAGDASSVRLPQGRRKGGRLVDTYLVESVLEAVLRLAEFEENSLAPCSLATDVLDLPPVPATADRFAGQGIYLTDSSRRRDYIIRYCMLCLYVRIMPCPGEYRIDCNLIVM
uniref:Uncharacterized protein n=1 Tax=Oryza punctata TaxID=4537 RepID=A0A0E0M2P9_ORYPU